MKTNNHFSKAEILKIYATCWNSLDSSKLNIFLHEAVEYNSMWVFETIVGKQAFIDYFSGKLNTLKLQKANTQIEAKLFMSLHGQVMCLCLVWLSHNNFKMTELKKRVYLLKWKMD